MSTLSKSVALKDNKQFYRIALEVAIPIMIQNGVTNLVSLLDNIMVGRLGTESMSGVSIVNQFVFVFSLVIFGAVSAAGIFTAQFNGRGDDDGVRNTFRIKIIICSLAAVLAIAVFLVFDDRLISLFLHDSSSTGNLALTLSEGKAYLRIALFGLIPFAISNVYASTMRETGETFMPMISSVASVVVNFVFNLLLIFGYLGFPAMGVRGAALATDIARVVECAIVIFYCHFRKDKFPFIRGALKTLKVPAALFKNIAMKGLPLVANEGFWALSCTLRNTLYSTRGLDVVAAQNIASTIINLMGVIYLSLGATSGILLGNQLGAGNLEGAKHTAKRMMRFSLICSVFSAVLTAVLARYFPMLYNTTEAVRGITSFMMLVCAFCMPLFSIANCSYFILRSGGQVMITILFDSVFMYAVVLPLCFVLAKWTNINIYWLFFFGELGEGLKMLLGIFLVRRGTWIKTLS